MIDCLAKNMEATQCVKEISDKKIMDMEGRIAKCETTLGGIMETSENIVKASADTISTMISKLEKAHIDKVFVDVDKEMVVGANDLGRPEKCTRACLKKKSIDLP